ncbi:MAG: ATP-dependent helicase [Chloroflexi bacterium]|nr:ATP-dependent helicase [Chloroflexota bacterium]MCY4246340.1 ATP-dependent helicase [Chloroflexota bacterium]
MFQPRPKQAQVLQYRGGYMGVAAVPGSGKTATLCALAGQLLNNAPLQSGQEILIVTLVNSAVANFSRQVNEFVKHEGFLPGWGYRVRTLHSLANEIVRSRATAARIDDDVNIVDERESSAILASAVDSWLRRQPDAARAWLGRDFLEKPHYHNNHWRGIVIESARNFIKRAKDELLLPEQLAQELARSRQELSLAQMCLDIYDDYERALAYRGALDFEDLIRLALTTLRDNPDYLAALRRKYPYILEDEAQDSSRSQEAILRLLAGPDGNWVRMGDPNQAIYETFTTADPNYLRDFIQADGVERRELPNSGRSTTSIQQLANHLIDWSLEHPQGSIRARQPLSLPRILPTPAGDPQPNPPDNPAAILLCPDAMSAEREAWFAAENCARWLEANPAGTAAILVARNTRGAEIVKVLRAMSLPYVENLNSASSTRAVVGSLAHGLRYLSDPKNPQRLGDVYRVWRRDDRADSAAAAVVDALVKHVRGIKQVEDLVAPRLRDWLDDNLQDAKHIAMRDNLASFREQIASWMRAADMPIDQLILSLAGDIFHDANDIATAHMIALHLAQLQGQQPQMRLPDFAEELYEIARNKRRFRAWGDEEARFDPDAHKGKVTVTTLHKAKGLEWDHVAIVSVNNYDFPSAESRDSYIGEKWFIRDELNLPEEALAQLDSLCHDALYREGYASLGARIDYAAERLRLLYVGITRARQSLCVSWNTGRRNSQSEATPLLALRDFWEVEMRRRAP